MDNTLEVISFKTCSGRVPFAKWYDQLDNTTQYIIDRHFARLKVGMFSDIRRIIGGDGICELRIHSGPGYRIYFAYESLNVIVILLGGSKNTQAKDIEKAKKYWKKYKEVHYGGKKPQK